MRNSDQILYTFLVESRECSEREFKNLNEDAKVESIRILAHDLMETIINVSHSIDTTPIDQSRGDIKSFRWLQDLQNAINQLEAILERSKSFMALPLAKEYVSTVIKSLYFLNQYSNIFRDAYRTKKSVLILRYQSVLMSIISAVAYLFSSLLDFSNNNVAVRENVRLEETAALRTLIQFNQSCASGELKVIANDTARLREFYNEIPSDKMNELLEANDIFSMVIDGVSNFYNNLDQGGRVTNLIYKSVGVIVALIAIREIFSAVSRSRFSIQDLLNNIKNFTNLSATSLPKLTQFSSRYRADAEENSKIAQRDTIANNKDIITNLKAVPSYIDTTDQSDDLNRKVISSPVGSAPTASADDFFF